MVVTLLVVVVVIASSGGDEPYPLVIEKEVIKEIIIEVPIEKEIIKEVPVTKIKEVIVEKVIIREVTKEKPVALDEDSYWERGEEYRKAGNYKLAVDEYANAIRLNPLYTAAYVSRGIAFGEWGLYEPAIQDFNKAIQLEPDHGKAYNARAYVYSTLGQHTKSTADLDKACALYPCPWMGVFLADLTPGVVAELGLPVREGVVIQDVLLGGPADNAGIRPGDIILSMKGNKVAKLTNLIWLLSTELFAGENIEVELFRSGSWKTLILTLGVRPHQTDVPSPTSTPWPTYTPFPTPTATPRPTYTPFPTPTATPTPTPTRMPPPTPTYSSKGEAYYGDGKYQLAINEYTAAIRLNPSSSGVYNNRGNAYFALGQYQRAIEDYDKAIKLDHYPRHAIYVYNRAKAYIKEGDRAAPAFYLIPGIEPNTRYTSTYRDYTYYVYSNNPPYHCCAEYGHRDYRKAKEDLNWAIQLDPHNAEAWYYRGVVYNIMCDCNSTLLAQLNFDKACSLAAQFCNIGPYPHIHFK